MVPQEIFVKFGGKRKKGSLSELQTLIQKKCLSPNSPIWIDGRQTRVGDVKDLLGLDVAEPALSCKKPGITDVARGNSLTNDFDVVFTEASKTANLDQAPDALGSENQTTSNLQIEVSALGADSRQRIRQTRNARPN